MNLYAPNYVSKRASLWLSLFDFAGLVDCWLLNVIYKIVAKAIALRLRLVVSSIIHDSQSCFLQDRSIFYNIFLFWEMVALV